MSYASSTSLHVGAAVVDGPEDPAYATLVGTEVLPSVAALARSSQVLAPVADHMVLADSPRSWPAAWRRPSRSRTTC